MDTALGQLGRVGFLYIGFDLYPVIYGEHDLAVLRTYNWWCPSYRANDGHVHPFHDNVPTDLVVIHQFASRRRIANTGCDEKDWEGLDQNRIVDARRWADVTGTRGSVRSEEELDMRLFPRRAVAHPTHPGRIGFIRFDPASKTLIAYNGIDFDRNQPANVWNIATFGEVVIAQLLVPAAGPLSYGESPDGRAVIIADDHDGGTFALPYKEIA
jgi:hypothetical protein